MQLQASYRMQKKRSDEISLANEKLSVLRGHLFETCIKRLRRKAEIRPNLLFKRRIKNGRGGGGLKEQNVATLSGMS